MSDVGTMSEAPIRARVVHKSLIVDQTGCRPVTKLMLNLSPGGRQFEVGADIAVSRDQSTATGEATALRYYTIEAVGDVPFEDTIDITLYVRHADGKDEAGVGKRLQALQQGESIELFGPSPYPFYPPMGSRSNMVMIGAGNGMTPFRWLAHKVQARNLDWMGKVLMLHGERTGVEHLYQNDPARDRDQYFDAATYRAFEALKTRYSANALDHAASVDRNLEALWRLMGQGSVYVYLAGYRGVAEALDAAMDDHLRLAGRWRDAKNALISDGHWLEVLYD